MSELHERMPVILDEEDIDRWFYPEQKDEKKKRQELQSLLVPLGDDRLQFYPVKTIVNNPRNEVPECIEPLE